MTTRRSIACLLFALTGCPHSGPSSHAPTPAGDGLAIAIYTAATPPSVPSMGQGETPATPPDSVALIDDRRSVEVADDGTLHLPDVAEGIELASLIIEPLDGKPLDVHSCVRALDRASVLGGRPATVTARDGSKVEGIVRSPSDPASPETWVIDDAEGHAHFMSPPDDVVVHGGAAAEVRCAVDAARGAHRVRLAYATSDLSWRAAYRLELTTDSDEGGTLDVQPTFTITGSEVIGTRHASVSLLVGLPGGDAPTRLAWRGEADLGEPDVAVMPPARAIAAHYEHIFRGAVTNKDDNPRGAEWRQTSTPDVWDAIGIAPAEAASTADLPSGPVLATVTIDGTRRTANAVWPEPAHVAAAASPRGVDVMLWPSPDLVGFRDRRQPYNDGARLIEQYLYSVANHGDAPVTVWVEEELRDGATWRQIRHSWPKKPERSGDLLRFPVKLGVGRIERLGFEAEYRW